MDRTKAYPMVVQILEKYRRLEFTDLVSMIGKTHSEEMFDSAGVRYVADITIFWSDSSHRDLVIHGRIDDHNTFRFSPLEEKVVVRNPDCTSR